MTEHEVSLEIGEKPVKVQEISPLGYGTPEAKISRTKQLENGELTLEVEAKAVELIISGDLMVAAHEHDDGCIDGRCAAEVTYFNGGGEEQTAEADNSNHERQKVAGGGYVTGSAMTLATGGRQSTANQQIAYTGELLSAKNIYCGVHTGPHESEEGTDCGANDKMPLILSNALEHAENIGENIEAMCGVAGLEYKPAVFKEVLDAWGETLNTDGFFDGSTGRSRLEEIKGVIKRAQEETGEKRPLAVSKRLRDDHKEDFIIVNFVEGKTFSQGAFAAELEEAFPDNDPKNLAQAFALDVPRLVKLAQALSTDDESFEKALYAGIAYQFATAATLTDGTLRTFIVHE